MPLLDDINDRLVAQGVGVRGETLFEGRRPQAPDCCLTVYVYAGLDSVKVSGGTNVVERPNVQLVARSQRGGYADAETLLGLAIAALDGKSFTSNGTDYLYVEAISSTFSLGIDENDRALIGVNMSVQKRP